MSPRDRVCAYLIARLREISTWRDLIVSLSAFGCVFTPEQTDAIISTGLLIAGTVGLVFPDRIGGNTRADDPPPTVKGNDDAKKS